MVFPRWQPGLRNEQVKFALGLKRPRITSTSVQTRFKRRSKFLNFYEIYEYFQKIFLFLGHILIFYLNFFFILWIFMKFISICETFFFFWIIDFSFENFFLMIFHKVYEYFRKIFLFLGHILLFYLNFFYFMNFHEVYEHFRNIFLFLNHIDFSFDKFFFMNFHEVYIFESFFFLGTLIFHLL